MKVFALLIAILATVYATNSSNNEAVVSSPSKFLSTKVAVGQPSIVPAPAVVPAVQSGHSLDMTSASMEAAITQLMLGKTAFGATPMGGSVKQIKNILTKTMMPKVTAAHKSDQANLKRLWVEIGKCGSRKTISLRKAVPSWKTYRSMSVQHKRCRNTEAVLYSSKQSCLAQQRSLFNVKKLKCTLYATISRRYSTQKSNVAAVRKASRESSETYIKRISRTFCGSHVHGSRGQHSRKGGWGGGLPNSILDKYLKAKSGCQQATKVYNAKVKECKRKVRSFRLTKGKCNHYQSLMDSNSCKHAVIEKDACEAYAGCYNEKVQAYRNAKAKAAYEERDRKAEWRGLERMSCLIDAFADGKISNKEIETCKKRTVNTRHLTLKYFNIPRLQKCAIPTLYPSTSPYRRKEFAPLPSLAKGRKSAECSGVKEISLTPNSGSPKSCRCSRVTLNGPYSAGAMVSCTNCLDARRSRDRNSCPQGTKLFAPASRTDWRTFMASAKPLRAPHWIIDITRPQNGCGGCRSPMNSRNHQQRSWRTADGAPWWLRSSRYGEPNGDYHANCYLGVRGGRHVNHVTFNDHNCNVHSKSYYCQTAKANLKPRAGSPKSCKCTLVTLAGKYSAGSLVRCDQCLTVRRSTEKNSCPAGMKIFSPRSRQDWKTILNSGGRIAAPHWIVDVTRPQNGCGGCTRYPMKSTQPQQASWRTSDGSPWWLRNSRFGEPNGDYYANCFMGLYSKQSENNIGFNDGRCAYHSKSYYCQPVQKSKRKSKPKSRPPSPGRVLVRNGLLVGLKQEVFYFRKALRRVPAMHTPNAISRARYVNQRSTGGTWGGLHQRDRFAVRWTGIVDIKHASNYRFQLTSDDGSKLYIDNRYVLNNDGLHGMRARNSGNMRLVKGQHWVRVEFFENGGGAGCILRYLGKDTGNRWKVTQNVRFPVIRGFKEEAFYGFGRLRRIPNLNRAPSMTRFIGVVNYRSTGGKWPGYAVRDRFAARWTGILQVHKVGNYRWGILSDDGSKFWLDNRLIINNDGLHGFRNREGNYRARSSNRIRLEFFENGGGAGMIFRYMGADTRNRMVTVPQNRMLGI